MPRQTQNDGYSLPQRWFRLSTKGAIYVLKKLAKIGPKPIAVLLAYGVYVLRVKFLLHLRHDDIVVATHMKSGTTWMQMILYQMLTSGDMDFDHLDDVTPFYDRAGNNIDRLDKVVVMPAPRIFKTHLKHKQFPKKFSGKIIYVYRDGMDVAVSQYHHIKNYFQVKITFDKCFKKYFIGKPIGPYSWAHHVDGWMENKNHLEILAIRFEDLKQNPESTIRQVADFCGIDLDDATLARVLERSSFDFMKQYQAKFEPTAKRYPTHPDATRGSFIRKGKSEAGREFFDAEKTRQYIEILESVAADKPWAREYLSRARRALEEREAPGYLPEER